MRSFIFIGLFLGLASGAVLPPSKW